MKRAAFLFLTFFIFRASGQDRLVYHDIKTDAAGNLIPWYDPDIAASFGHIIDLTWNFWDTMRIDRNGLPYYLNHAVWRAGVDDPRGIGGDQLQMALSSWQLLYAYSGNEKVKQDMKLMADYYLIHSASPTDCKWPFLPFPYNTLVYSGIYDGDMILGQGYLQPDKAGSFGLELVHLYKMSDYDFYFRTNVSAYLDGAKRIARTLCAQLKPGDRDQSPLPFKVNVFTGETAAPYSSNWSATMQLLLELQTLDTAQATMYQRSFTILLDWMKKYPMENNRWGPFFEDVRGWSDTQINAMTFAEFIMEHPGYFPDWKNNVKSIVAWIYQTLGNDNWKNYGVSVVNEQTIYKAPGQSHTARQGAAELCYAALSGDTSRKANAIRQLVWASYAVDEGGRSRYPKDEVWLTDGYGDFIRHYLRAMAAFPEYCPSSENHILSSSSVVQRADYLDRQNKAAFPDLTDAVRKGLLYYRTFDDDGTEKIRMTRKPAAVLLNGRLLTETASGEGWTWQALAKGGLLIVRRLKGTEVLIK
jgi:hypothetical protein